MLVLFFGNDTIKARAAAYDYIEQKKDEGLTSVAVDQNSFEPGFFKSAAKSGSLFGDRTVYLVDTPSEKKDMYEEVVAALPDMADSEHAFVVVEGVLLAAEKKKFEQDAEQMQEYKKTAALRFNNFALADALAKKDKRSLWLLLSEARLEGISDEELVGVLWWQLKTLRLAALTSFATQAGLKDFPYNKAKRALQRFSVAELTNLSHSLISLSHDSRLGRQELDLALERWVLKL